MAASRVDDVDVAALVDLAELERVAVARMSDALRDVIQGVGGWGKTLRANEDAWQQWALRQRALVDVSSRDTTTTVLGQSVELPVLVAPFGGQALCHPDAEVATAVACALVGTIMMLSMAATRSPEEVGRAGGRFWMQVYWARDRGLIRESVERAVAAGATALCVMIDQPVMPWYPAAMRRALEEISFAPEMGNFLNQEETRNIWEVLDPEIGQSKGLFDPGNSPFDASVTWDDLEWLRGLSSLPLVPKGIMDADDARKAADHGAAAIVVSNHGGFILDQALPTADVLPEIVEAVDGRVEVLVDGGIRSGADVFRAVALGARAVLIGRPALWGLVLGGADGAARVLTLLRQELDVLMGMTGVRSIAEIDGTRVARHDTSRRS